MATAEQRFNSEQRRILDNADVSCSNMARSGSIAPSCCFQLRLSDGSASWAFDTVFLARTLASCVLQFGS